MHRCKPICRIIRLGLATPDRTGLRPCTADTHARRLPRSCDSNRGSACLPKYFPVKKNPVQKLRHLAFQRQNCRCYYCNLPMWEGDLTEFCQLHGLSSRQAKHLQCTAEHLLAQKDGGRNSAENVAAACLWCNKRRHLGRQDNAPDPLQYKRRIQHQISKGKWHPLAARLSVCQQNSHTAGSNHKKSVHRTLKAPISHHNGATI